jgi:Asp-tRNA(Asn)/Glu-tRNA(Gln) amidotransferase A subunit family amidase
MEEPTTHEVAYELKSVKLPHLTGLPLRLLVALIESPLRGLLAPSLLRNFGLSWLREQQVAGPPTLQPLSHTGDLVTEGGRVREGEWPGPPSRPGPGFRFATVHDCARAYRQGDTTPEEVAERVLEAIERSDAADPPLRAFIAVDPEDVLHQARAAAARIRDGQALSIFDGVPVAIKDELDMTPYPTTVGTSFLGTRPETQDATIVARLRASGALLIGKTSMHEIGIGVTGLNPHHGTPRNPYNPGHYTGGSSSGPAAAVAAGLCPVAIGLDGGGSIRVPSSFCGLVGLQSTFGRVSEHGAAPLSWSLVIAGPLAATVTDAALAYAVIAGPDPRDQTTLSQPTPTLAGWDNLDLSDLTLGVYWRWFRHATADVVSTCEGLLAEFERLGASVREIAIPDLEAGRIAHVVTIAAEMTRALEHTYADHRRDHGLDVRLNLALARLFTARDYVKAQQIRTRLRANFARVFGQVDAVITPAAGMVAPPIPKAALSDGESDLSTLTEIMRYAAPANMTGLPAISFPAGYDGSGLPIGMQAMGRAWQEPNLLRLALAAEQAVERQAPRVYFPLLPEANSR